MTTKSLLKSQKPRPPKIVKSAKWEGPAWVEDAVFYQIYPQSFLDTNGDGIGDIPGIIAKLDYILDLGCNALWLNPVFVSPFGDAGYDVADFRKVAPRYGTNADLRRLFREAHKRNMRVVLDIVAGHTSIDHPWFKESSRHARNLYSDYYIWTPNVWTAAPGCSQVNGFGERNGNYLTNFFWFQPALNFGFYRPDPEHSWQQGMEAPGPRAVKDELKSIMRFWLDQGCDGFRVDMAASLIRNDPDGEGIKLFWNDFRRWLDHDYPQAVLISEWCNPRRAIAAGFHVDFMIHFGELAYQKLCNPWGDLGADGLKLDGGFFHKAKPGPIADFLTNFLDHYHATHGRGYISLPTGNHDFARFNRGRDAAEQRVFHAMLLTMPGVPFIYYGDEIGLPFQEGLASKEGGYNRTGTRTPMRWTRGRNAGFSDAPSRELYLPVAATPTKSTVAGQVKDRGSMLHLVRNLLALRREYSALGNQAPFKVLGACKDQLPFTYQRGEGNNVIMVVINPSSRAVKVDFNALKVLKPLLAEGSTIEGNKLVMAPVSFGIYLIKGTMTLPERRR